MSIIQVVSSQTRHVGEFMFLDKMTETASKMMKYIKKNTTSTVSKSTPKSNTLFHCFHSFLEYFTGLYVIVSTA